jgi:DNA adenine methylase
LLKWLGGKTQLLEAIAPLVPVAIRNYHEPFVGGGSVLFAVLRMAAAGRVRISGGVYASDNNRALIAFYKHVQARPRPLYKLIRAHFDTYNAIPQLKSATKRTRGISATAAITVAESRQSKEGYYYWLRDTYNTANLAPNTSLQASALFYALNKLDFRGLYRESRAGTFNAAFGHYAKAPECTCDTFVNASRLIQPVVFAHRDFRESLANVSRGDFVYLDPPYAPPETGSTKSKSSFVSYTPDGFGTRSHAALFASLRQLHATGVSFVMSNSDVRVVREGVDGAGFHVRKVTARRAIHSRKPQSTATEVIVCNTVPN